MLDPYITDYLLFTFLVSFSVLQIALAKGSRARITVGIAILLTSYLWFFCSRNRNVHTGVEGVQLALIFVFGAGLAVVATRVLNLLIQKK